MKIRKLISTQIIQIVLGLFIGLFTIVQSVHVHQQVEIRADDQGCPDGARKESQQLTLEEAVPFSIPQINLSFQSFLLEEVAFEDETEDKNTGLEEWILAAQKALRVLLLRIISPNAP